MSSKAHTWHRKYFHTDYHVRRPPCIATIIIIYRCSKVLTWSHTINSHFLVWYMDGNGKYETNCDSFGFRSGFGFDASLSTLTFSHAISWCVCCAPFWPKLCHLCIYFQLQCLSQQPLCVRECVWGCGVYQIIFARHETFDGRKVIKLNANDYAECVDKRLYIYIYVQRWPMSKYRRLFPFLFWFLAKWQTNSIPNWNKQSEK